MMKIFNPEKISLTRYLFFTGKGGVGKTSAASATAVNLADAGKKILLISTDPASNLQDIFNTELTGKETHLNEVPNLTVLNLDPIKSAEEYKEKMIAPYRGKLPEPVIQNMEEQLSGSCTVEIAAFNEFSGFITDENSEKKYDHIIFDTAPTGHTLRMLQLPSAWTDFISTNTHGASCLGQLSGLDEKKSIYKKAVERLSDKQLTTILLVARPDSSPLKEAARASGELSEIGLKNQVMIINGLLKEWDDAVSESLYNKQQRALKDMPEAVKTIETYYIPLRAYNICGIETIRAFLGEDVFAESEIPKINGGDTQRLDDIVDDLFESGKKVIFAMGKGGVGKTTIAAAVASRLAEKGRKVHLTTTDPAAHIKFVIDEKDGLTISRIDEEYELEKYRQEVLSKAGSSMSDDDIAYLEEDLRSPCTREIAVFRAFANIVEKADNETVVIDTAPTGHTLLLLDSTQSYHREVQRSQGDIPESVKKLLPRLRNEKETEVLLITLAETTPVFEAMRLKEDLNRAGIQAKWWVINSSMYAAETTNSILQSKGNSEVEWINKVDDYSKGNFALIRWFPEEIQGDALFEL